MQRMASDFDFWTADCDMHAIEQGLDVKDLPTHLDENILRRVVLEHESGDTLMAYYNTLNL